MYKIAVNKRELYFLDEFNIAYRIIKESSKGTSIFIEAASNLIDELNSQGTKDIKTKLFNIADELHNVYNVTGKELENEVLHTIDNLSTKFHTKPKEQVYKLIPLAVEEVGKKYKDFFEKEKPKEDVLEKSTTEYSPFVTKTKLHEGWEEFLIKNKDLSESAIHALLSVEAITDNDLDFAVAKINEETANILLSLDAINSQLLSIQKFMVQAPSDASFIIAAIKPRIENIELAISPKISSLINLLASMEARSKINL